MQAALRAAVVQLLKDYAADAHIKLQVYPGRPRTLYPPTAFVDTMHERITYDGLRQRYPTAEVVVVWGLFDSAEAVAQRDAFVDGFLDWWTDKPHAVSANSISDINAFGDLPAYVPDWVEAKNAYYATLITVEGYTS